MSPAKKNKNRRNIKFWKMTMQKQISSWRKQLSIIAETGTGSDNGKLKRKKRKVLKIYRVTNAREFVQFTETLQQKVQAKSLRIRKYEKEKPSIVRIRSLKKKEKNFTETWS